MFWPRSWCVLALTGGMVISATPRSIQVDSLDGYFSTGGTRVRSGFNIRKDHTFRYQVSGCFLMDSCEGTWRMDGEILELTPSKPGDGKTNQGPELRLLVVKWDNRTLLVPENSAPAFAASAKAGAIVAFTERVPDEPRQLVLKGKPILPTWLDDFYEKGPVRAEVLGIRGDGNVRLGKFGGRLKPGMLLASGEHDLADLEVLSVSGEEAIGKRIFYWASRYCPGIGSTFTTGDAMRAPQPGFMKRYDFPGNEL